MAMHEREPFAPAQVRVAQFVLIEAELVQNRGMGVAQMAAILDGGQADLIGGETIYAAPTKYVCTCTLLGYKTQIQ
jgi:hypothetical protein